MLISYNLSFQLGFEFKLNVMNLFNLDHIIRKPLNSILSAKAFIALYSLGRSKALDYLKNVPLESIDVAQNPKILFGELTFRNDLGNAAGFDKDGTLLPFNYKIGAGFAVVGTVLHKTHTGNLFSCFTKKTNVWTPLPHSNSAINSLGLPSKGVDVALDNIKRFQDQYQPKEFPIGLSIMGHPLDEGQAKLDGVLNCIEKAVGIVDFIEINESCPNVAHGHFNLDELKTRLSSIQQVKSSTPTLIKMGAIPDIKALLDVLVETNMQGLIALNTQTNYDTLIKQLHSSDQHLASTYIQNYKGGMSGSVIKEHSFKVQKEIFDLNSQLDQPLSLVHVGGIKTSEDVKQSRMVADLREWYTCFMSALGERNWKTLYRDMVGA